MENNDPLSNAKSTVEVVGALMKAAGDDPQVKQAAKNLGQTAVLVTQAINNVLLPIAAVNFAFDKARVYFSERFPKDLEEKTRTIPVESIVEPKASIAGPALQGLAFTHEEPGLKDMYLSLLATAMDGRVAQDAHPAFVEIIKQLNGEEARLVQNCLINHGGIPIVQVRLTLTEDKGYMTLQRHMIDFKNMETLIPVVEPRLPAMIDNWIRLGLVEVEYGKYLTAPTAYDWCEQRPELAEFRRLHEIDGKKVTFYRGLMTRTELGLMFAKAIGIVSP